MDTNPTGAKSRLLMVAAIAAGLFGSAVSAAADGPSLRGTGDLGIVIERAVGRIEIIETTTRTKIGEIAGLGDLSHATAVFSRDGRYAFIFGRDGGLNKVDLLTMQLVKRIEQAGNSIGGAISQDGALVAVANYEPGGVRVFDSQTLEQVADIPSDSPAGRSKVVGLVSAPGARFVFSLYDAGEIWIADFSDRTQPPRITKFPGIGKQPYDGVVTPDGQFYVAGLFGEDKLALLDLSQGDGVSPRPILDGYRRGETQLPVYKMPHLAGWTAASGLLFLPAVGRHEILVVDRAAWAEIARIPVYGQPVFAVARPDGRQVWVNFAHPDNGVIDVIDVASLKVARELSPGHGVMHMEFTPRGDQVWVSLRDDDRVDVFDPANFSRIASLPADKPSGIFMTARANRIGQ
jgi:protein NirF